MTISATAPPPCSPPWKCWRGASSGSALSAIGIRSSCAFCGVSTRNFLAPSPCTWSWITMERTNSPRVRAWLERHPRFVPHFVPTSSSWLNLIDRWFGELTSKRVRRGSFRSVEELGKAIREFLAVWNEHPKPLSGRQRWNRSKRNLLAVARLWSRFNPVLRCLAAERGGKHCPVHSRILHSL